MKTRFSLVLGILATLALSGCQNNDRVKDLTTLQTQAEIEEQKNYQESRSRDLEADLLKRQYFFQGTAGTYEGSVKMPEGEYAIRIRLVPTVPAYKPAGRVRTADEVINDINALHFNAQIVQWKVGSNLGVVGCRVDNVRPDLNEGMIQIASSDCPSFYDIHLSDGSQISPDQSSSGEEARGRVARDISRRIMAGQHEKVLSLSGSVYPTAAAASYSFEVFRRGEQ